MKKKILFGAGMYGRLALEKYGRENVAFFDIPLMNNWTKME